MFATTKFVRNLVRSFYNERLSGGYTDKSKRKGADNLRYVAFEMGKADAERVKKDLEFVLFTLGYKNKVTVTTSKYYENARSGGWTYLRIKDCVLD